MTMSGTTHSTWTPGQVAWGLCLVPFLYAGVCLPAQETSCAGSVRLSSRTFMVFVSGSLFPVFLETGRSFFLVFSHLGLNDVISLTACVQRRESSSRRAGERGRRVGGSKGWTLRRGWEPRISRFFCSVSYRKIISSLGVFSWTCRRDSRPWTTHNSHLGFLGVIVCEPRWPACRRGARSLAWTNCCR